MPLIIRFMTLSNWMMPLIFRNMSVVRWVMQFIGRNPIDNGMLYLKTAKFGLVLTNASCAGCRLVGWQRAKVRACLMCESMGTSNGKWPGYLYEIASYIVVYCHSRLRSFIEPDPSTNGNPKWCARRPIPFAEAAEGRFPLWMGLASAQASSY